MDTSGTRCFCGFMTELGQRVPAAMLPVMESLLVHLGGEVCTVHSSLCHDNPYPHSLMSCVMLCCQ